MATDPTLTRRTAQRYVELAARFGQVGPPAAFAVLQSRNVYIRREQLLELRQATVLSGEWFVVADDQVFSDGFVQTPSPPLSAYLIGLGERDGSIGILFDKKLQGSVEQAFLLGGCTNYSHWMLDYLPRLKFDTDRTIPLLVNGPLARFQSEGLDFLGIGRDRLIELAYPAAYSVDRLLYPSLMSSSTTPPHSFQPAVLDWLRQSFAPLMEGAGGRRVFISRNRARESHQRRLLNHDAVAEVARRHGFEIIEPETMSFIEQVRAFSQASVIAGAHGAGFTNMVFAPPGTRIIELIGPEMNGSAGAETYVRLAQMLHQRLRRVVGRPGPEGARPLSHLPDESFEIDPAEFERALTPV